MASSSSSAHDHAIREKVQAVREVVPGRSNNELVLVLQHYDYSVEHAIQAFLEDGAREVLKEWQTTAGPNKVTSKKKKKSKNKTKDPVATATISNSTPDSTNSHNSNLHDHISQNGHVTSDINSNSVVVKGLTNGQVDSDLMISQSSLPSSTPDLTPAPLYTNRSDALQLPTDHALHLHSANESQASSCSTLSSPSTLSSSSRTLSPAAGTTLPLSKDTKTNSSVSSLSDVSVTSNISQPVIIASSLLSVSSNNVDSTSTRLTMDQSNNSSSLEKQQSSGKNKPHSRPKTLEVSNKSSHRERTASETSTASVSSMVKGKGLEKSVKDLHRQASSLQRIKILLNDEVERSFKEITQTFEKLHHVLNEREAELMFGMDKVKNQAQTILTQRQVKAAELKQRTDCHQPEHQLVELRADVKHFVSDRKIDEDLGSTKRYVCDLDSMLTQLKEFGTVTPVKASYSARRSSSSSLTSSVLSPEDLQSPFSPSVSHNSTTLLAATAAASTTVVPSSVVRSQLEKPDSCLLTNQKIGGAKVVSQSDSVTRYEVTELQNRLAGIKVSDTKPRGNSRNAMQKRSQNPRPAQGQKPQQNLSEGPDLSGEGKKSRNARRRQKQRERQKEQKRNGVNEGGNNSEEPKTDRDSKSDNVTDTQTDSHKSGAQGGKRPIRSNRRTPSPRKTTVPANTSQPGEESKVQPETGDPTKTDQNGPKVLGPRPDSGNRRNRNQRSRSRSAGGKQGQGNMKAVTVSVKERIVEDGNTAPREESSKRTVEMTNANGTKTATVKVEKPHAEADESDGLPQRKVRSRRKPKEGDIAVNGIMTNGLPNGEMSDSH